MLTPLVIILIAFGLILGFYTKGQALRKLGRVLLIVALAPIFIGIGQNYFYQLTPLQKAIFLLIIIPVGIIIILRILLGKDLFSNIAGNFIYDGLKAFFIFPFRLISKIFSHYK